MGWATNAAFESISKHLRTKPGSKQTPQHACFASSTLFAASASVSTVAAEWSLLGPVATVGQNQAALASQASCPFAVTIAGFAAASSGYSHSFLFFSLGSLAALVALLVSALGNARLC